jgi:hypothetical protein
VPEPEYFAAESQSKKTLCSFMFSVVKTSPALHARLNHDHASG